MVVGAPSENNGIIGPVRAGLNREWLDWCLRALEGIGGRL